MIMMFTCSYFLWIDGIFSYAGFVAIEVIGVSTLATLLTFLDAIQALKCRNSDLKRVEENQQFNGVQYESEDEDDGKRLRKRRRNKALDEFGDNGANEMDPNDGSSVDESQKRMVQSDMLRSQYSGNPQVSDETQRQMAMLEELAKQMREEKEQLRLEKERIERERALMMHEG